MLASKHNSLSIRHQCQLLGINRSSVYYVEKATDLDDIELLNRIRDIWTSYPFYGYRRITKELRSYDIVINRKRVQRLMQEGNIQAIYPKPNTSIGNKAHKKYPYLLGGLKINKANLVWQVDIYVFSGNH